MSGCQFRSEANASRSGKLCHTYQIKRCCDLVRSDSRLVDKNSTQEGGDETPTVWPVTFCYRVDPIGVDDA